MKINIAKIIADHTADYLRVHYIDIAEQYRRERKSKTDDETNVMLDDRERARDINSV
ncbi:hypothetical protein LCGC14_2115380 [marine sediment metagenome]|uniref:Uncharacterized protein n=1 Tax=marine sediment metagenome TaxID=412755 RepID=A0A0F9E5W1_9ZZZZ